MSTAATPNDDLMTIDELARLLGLKPESVRWYLCQSPERVPPRVTWSRKPLWSRAIVSAWLAARNGADELAKRLKPASKALEQPPRVAKRGRPRQAR
jgi:hypothetical protein